MATYKFRIEGIAIPQGSKTATVINGRAVMFDSNKKLKAWRAAVTEQVNAQMVEKGCEPFLRTDPVAVIFTAFLPKPKTVKRDWMTVKPDLDKLARALLDGISDTGLWQGDEQVTNLCCSKKYIEADPYVEIVIYNKLDTMRK